MKVKSVEQGVKSMDGRSNLVKFRELCEVFEIDPESSWAKTRLINSLEKENVKYLGLKTRTPFTTEFALNDAMGLVSQGQNRSGEYM